MTLPLGESGESGSQAQRGPSPAATASDPPANGRVKNEKTESIGDARGYMLSLLRSWLLDRGLYFSIHQSDIVAELLDGI